ncbi:MAG: hypothetical protein QNK63_07275 [Flavobacteriales bacterium]
MDRKASTETLSLESGVSTRKIGYSNSNASFEKSKLLIKENKKTLKKTQKKKTTATAHDSSPIVFAFNADKR